MEVLELHPVSTYILAKDGNRPELMRGAFAEEAELEMVVKTGTISFPPFTRGVGAITDVLVTRFGESFENVRTFCLADPPQPGNVTFSCDWLVGMSEKQTGAVRVGCGRYDWSFEPDRQLASRLRITVEHMETLPPGVLGVVMKWLSALPYPWCAGSLAILNAPPLEQLRRVIRYLERVAQA